MSRSKRKTPVTGWTKSESDKKDKKITNKKFRRISKTQLDKYDEDSILVEVKDISHVTSKDGKQRFDPNEFPDLMRK